MKEIIDKLSSYNLFNYLLPGIIFAVFADEMTHYSFIQQDNIIICAFLCYFVGLVISRFGSLVVEPILELPSFVKTVDYKTFTKASRKDAKLDLLLEVSNTYRTFISLFFLLFLLKLYENIEGGFYSLKDWGVVILLVILSVLFLFAYEKQYNYYLKQELEVSDEVYQITSKNSSTASTDNSINSPDKLSSTK